MGTSYQTLLVVGGVAVVRDTLAAAGVDGLVVSAGPDRTAVIPQGDHRGYIDPAALARLVSGRTGRPALSNEVSDSDVVLMHAFRDGRLTHEYVSDESMLVDWFIDADGTTKFRIGDVEYPAEAPYPRGPRGADAAMLAPFGVAPVDLDRLGAALRGEFDGNERFAEIQHNAILRAMNLDPRGLTAAFRSTRIDDLPGAVSISEPVQHDVEEREVGLVIVTGLPIETDPREVCQVIADAVKSASFRMRADVGYLGVIPAAANAERILSMSDERLAAAPRRATFFVALHVKPPTGGQHFEDQSFATAATGVWATALRSRYGLDGSQGPWVGMLAPEPFTVGFRAAEGFRSTQPRT
jgi:hypothetical protein